MFYLLYPIILHVLLSFPIIQLPEYLISTVLFARQNTSYTHTDGKEFPSLFNARSLVS